jgi:hypothetical protein
MKRFLISMFVLALLIATPAAAAETCNPTEYRPDGTVCTPTGTYYPGGVLVTPEPTQHAPTAETCNPTEYRPDGTVCTPTGTYYPGGQYVEFAEGTQITPTDTGVRVRALPSLDGEILFYAQPGEHFTVIEGPAQGTGLIWWRIRGVSGEGWVAGSFIEVVNG